MTSNEAVKTHIQILHDKARGLDGKLVLASFGEDPTTHNELPNKVRHFNIGDVEGMTQAAIEWSQEQGRNVYTPLAVMRSDLGSNSKGGEKDVVALLGLVADYDDGKGTDYQKRCGDLEPSFAYETSQDNVQAYFLSQAPLVITNEKDRNFAKELAVKLTNACDGADDCGVDISHVWRIPGLPNYPNEKKVKNGRDPNPFTVRIKKPFDGTTTPVLEFAKLPAVAVTPQQDITVEVEYKAPVNIDNLDEELRTQITDKAADGVDRSELAASVICKLANLGHGTGDIIECIAKNPKGIGERYNADTGRIESDVIRVLTKFYKVEESEQIKPFVMEAFEPFNVKDIEPRPFIFGSYLIRKMLSLLIAPPGVGKSSLSLSTAVSVVTGKPILGITVHEKGNVAVINNEDDTDEMRRRLAGILQQHDISQDELTGKLFLHSGETYPFQIAKYDAEAKALRDHHKCDLIENLIENNISLLIVDPFLETHEGNENDNREMSQICMWYREVAQKANCALLIVHHTRKEDGKSSGGHAGNQDSGRGASSITGVSRVVVTLYNMDAGVAKKLGIPEKQKHEYIRLDDAKANLSKVSGETKWFKRESVTIANGDSVGVLLPVQLVEKTNNHELEFIAAICQAKEFEEIRQMEGEDIPRGEIIKAMKKYGIYLGDKTTTRSTMENRLEKLLVDEGISHHGCTVKMVKKSGHYYVQINLPKPETVEVATLPKGMQKLLGNCENSMVFTDLPQSA